MMNLAEKVKDAIEGAKTPTDKAWAALAVIQAHNQISTPDELTALKEENARLREALEPFAKAADVRLCGEWGDEKHFGRTDIAFHLTFGDLRRARAALQEKHPHD